MPHFVMMTRGCPKAWNDLGPEQTQRVMERYHAFVDRLKSEKRFKGGSALKPGNTLLSSSSGKVILDGPYTESKEAVTGYLLFEAASRTEAIEIARLCPALSHGESVELAELSED